MTGKPKRFLPSQRSREALWTVWTPRSSSRLRSWRLNGQQANALPSLTSLHHIAGFLRERRRVGCSLSALACPAPASRSFEFATGLCAGLDPAATRAISVRFRWQPRARGSRLRIERCSRHLCANARVPFVAPIGHDAYSHASLMLTGQERPAPYSFRVQKRLLMHLL